MLKSFLNKTLLNTLVVKTIKNFTSNSDKLQQILDSIAFQSEDNKTVKLL
jgi:hypothetical protein